MKISYEPLVPSDPVKFTVVGFPDEDQIKLDIENFYKNLEPSANRKFVVHNAFKEIIFTGSANNSGEIEEFVVAERDRYYQNRNEKDKEKAK